MYRKRLTSGLKKNPDPNPSKLFERSISLNNQNRSENLNFLSQNLASNHNSLPNNNISFKSFSQNNKTATTLFIKPQLTIEKAREISQSQKSNSSQQSPQNDENSITNIKFVEAKNNIKVGVKTDNFDKSQQKDETLKINSIPKLVDTKSFIKANSKIDLIPKTTEEQNIKGKGKLKKFNTTEQNSGLHKDKLNIQVVSKHAKESIAKPLKKQNIAKSKVVNKEQKNLIRKIDIKENEQEALSNSLEKVKRQKNVTSKRLQKTTRQTNENVIKTQKKATSKISLNRSACSEESRQSKENTRENQENKIRLSQVAILSQPNKSLSHRERLEWLRDRRGVGTYIQCSNNDCSKWRYESNIKDPIDVPEKWFCSMNSDDKLANCDAPENHPSLAIEEDFIHNSYTAGSIVWARLRGYPWWPAMVDDDPDTEQYYWLDDFCDIPTNYHVVFFQTNTVSRSWIARNDLEVFKTGEEHTRTKLGKKDYTDQIKFAKTQALAALKLNIPERLYKYGFLARWKGPINTPSPSESGSDIDEEVDVCDLDTLIQFSRELSSSHNDSLKVYASKAVKKNRKQKTLKQGVKKIIKKTQKRKILNENDELANLVKISCELNSSHNDSSNQSIEKELTKTKKRKGVDKNEKVGNLDTTLKLSRDLNSNLTDSFDRNVNKVLKKNRKRIILDDVSSLEYATNSKTTEVHKSLDEIRAIDSVTADSTDPILNNATITNELFKDLINHRENEITSTVDIFTDVISLHSSNMFDSDEENLPTQLLQKVN